MIVNNQKGQKLSEFIKEIMVPTGFEPVFST